MNKKLLVFLRAYNDIDHITPILYKWLSITDIPVVVVITTQESFLHDYRIEFLRQFQNLTLHHIDHFLSKAEQTRKKNLQYIIYDLHRFHPYRLGYIIWKRFIMHDSLKLFPSIYDEIAIGEMLDSILGNVNKVIIAFDWIFTDFVKSVNNTAKERGYKTVSLPHGDRPFYNLMETLDDLDFSRLDKSASDLDIFDYRVYPNTLCAVRYESSIDSENIKILGSPRYNSEWIDIISSLIPKYDDHKSRVKLKIVFFLRNYNYSIFWYEVIRTIKLILGFPDIYLIVKHHTRSATVSRLINTYPELGKNSSNLEFVYDDTHSGSLIQWADVILDLGTSVAFEAVKQKKPVLAMEYLHANRSTVAHYMKSCEINCRDDLYNWITRFIKNGTSDFYDESERQRFIDDMIDVPDANVLSRYIEFLESLFSVKTKDNHNQSRNSLKDYSSN